MEPFTIKVTRFGQRNVGKIGGYYLLVILSFAVTLLFGMPSLFHEPIIDLTYINFDFDDLLMLSFIPLGMLVGRKLTYFGQTGQLIFTELGIAIKDVAENEVFKAWNEHKIAIYLDGYIEQKINGKTRQGNRKCVLIASDNSAEKHFFQVFGKIQMAYLLEQLKPLQEKGFLKISAKAA